MLEINTNKLSQRKHVEIDGHYYIVRKMGAGDQLTISQYLRELEILSQKEKRTPLSKEEVQRVAQIEKASLEISARCFDDQEDGKKSWALVSGLTPEELVELMGQIFKDEVNSETEVS